MSVRCKWSTFLRPACTWDSALTLQTHHAGKRGMTKNGSGQPLPSAAQEGKMDEPHSPKCMTCNKSNEILMYIIIKLQDPVIPTNSSGIVYILCRPLTHVIHTKAWKMSCICLEGVRKVVGRETSHFENEFGERKTPRKRWWWWLLSGESKCHPCGHWEGGKESPERLSSEGGSLAKEELPSQSCSPSVWSSYNEWGVGMVSWKEDPPEKPPTKFCKQPVHHYQLHAEILSWKTVG